MVLHYAADIGFSFLLLGIAEAIVKPFAIEFVDRVFLPNLRDIYIEEINPRSGEWFSEGRTREEMIEEISGVMANRINNFAKQAKPIRKYLIKRLRSQYDFVEHAAVVKEAGVKTVPASTSEEVVIDGE